MQDKTVNTASVLVIDDDEVNRIVLKKLFDKENIRAFFAESGEKGVALAREKKPCLILLDVFMPGEDGFEFLKQLKNDPDLSSIAVFIFSILTNPDKISQAYNMGADGYITKPFNMKETVVKVKEILAGKNEP